MGTAMVAIDNTADPSTDRLPVVSLAPPPPSLEVPRSLMRAIWATGIAVAVCALVLLASGALVGRGHAAVAHRVAPGASLLTVTSTGPRQATYRLPAGRFGLTITTDRPTWIHVGPSGSSPAFSGVLAAGASRHFDETGPTSVDVGAGGSTIDVQSGALHQMVTPPVAPFTAVFEPR